MQEKQSFESSSMYSDNRVLFEKNTSSDVTEIYKKAGRTRIRTGVVRIRTESDDHYTIQPVMDATRNASGYMR